jgi:hypothetical protein
MCKVSDQLKLCTCNAVGEEPSTHYWILYKYRVSNAQLIGLLMLPITFNPDIEQYNRNTLKHLLNEKNCFDFDVQLEENDCLELNFRVEPEQEKHLRSKGEVLGPKFVTYEFEYKNGRWVDAEWNPFHNDLTEKMRGKITNAFENGGY